jgi:hypothetical protein
MKLRLRVGYYGLFNITTVSQNSIIRVATRTQYIIQVNRAKIHGKHAEPSRAEITPEKMK